MTIRPIIFSAPMVHALLEGRKTQTRRVLKPRPEYCGPAYARDPQNWSDPDSWGWENYDTGSWKVLSEGYTGRPYYAPGDLLWVREAWRPLAGYSQWDCRVLYSADGAERHLLDGEATPDGDWLWPKAAAKGFVPSIHMPRWASRLTLSVTDVRVQRVQDISEEDAAAEGVRGNAGGAWGREGLIEDFADLWNTLHGPDAWDRNDWVAAISFETIHKNVGEVEG